MLFERYQSNGRSRQYYACSACRDRKDCSFFHWADEKFSKTKRDLWDTLIKDSQPKDTEVELCRWFIFISHFFNAYAYDSIYLNQSFTIYINFGDIECISGLRIRALGISVSLSWKASDKQMSEIWNYIIEAIEI